MSIAFVFPGQGSQSVGMLASLADIDTTVGATFAEASAALGYDLWKLIQAGPADELNATEATQPAMLAAGIATARLWDRRGGVQPAVVSGHSLGEFTALVYAGSLEFATAIDLVRFRGRVMQEAVPVGTGAMAAILGLEDAEVQAVCEAAAQGAIVEAVNFNSPGQVVIAGESAAVQRAIELAKSRGAKRAVPLPVSVPSHSSLMKGAAKRLAERLATLDIGTPRIPYISAVDAQVHSDPADIRALLVRQLASPVRWSDTVRALALTGIRFLVECGPGKVLTSLNRRCDRASGIQCLALDDPASLEAALATLKGTPHA